MQIKSILSILLMLFMSVLVISACQSQMPLKLATLAPLPDKEGFAGMFAGVSEGQLFCMGGANFPEKRPWEGGTKKWYSNIYKLDNSGQWTKLDDTLPTQLAYGVSVSLNNKIYVIGGNRENVHTDKVFSLKWNGAGLLREELPSLPIPLANMAGALVGHLIILAGGASTAGGEPLKKCYGLDLDNINKGWFELPSWPGSARAYASSAVIEKQFFVFSGERVAVNDKNEKFRYILQDAFCFTPEKIRGKWTGTWKPIAPLPKGAAAAGNPLPVLQNGSIIVSGGVDAVTALHTHQATHPGINPDIQIYNPKDDSWQLIMNSDTSTARVTLPVVYWNKQWVFISGEIKPGVRTNSIVSIKD